MRRLSSAALVLFFVGSFSAEAASVTRISSEALTPLRAAAPGERVRLERLPLEVKDSFIDLEEFQVWAPGGKVSVHHADGSTTFLDPPDRRYFRGVVNGDNETFAFFSVDRGTKAIQGLIATRKGRFAVNSQRPPRRGAAHRNTESWDDFVTEAGTSPEESASEEGWMCEVDRKMIDLPVQDEDPDSNVAANGAPVAQAISGTQSYAVSVEIETDFELYQNAGSNATTLNNYVTNLMGAVATIYARDLNVLVVVAGLHVYDSSGDPWASGATGLAGLNALANYYHTASRPS